MLVKIADSSQTPIDGSASLLGLVRFEMYLGARPTWAIKLMCKIALDQN